MKIYRAYFSEGNLQTLGVPPRLCDTLFAWEIGVWDT